MKLYAVSYFNIGPFANSKISIFIKNGKFLIQSPIGRGKSFLFFDGLVYALYGYSKRDVLNVECSEGFTKIIFQNSDGDIFFLQRPLTGKKGARLFKFIGNDIEANLPPSNDIIAFDYDFSDDLDMSMYEEIEFHRISELQQYIDVLLPPRSVFLQRHIIMQDEENIFELQAKARIEILKKMFGLDAIDGLRDTLSEIKNNLKGQLKVLQEGNHIVEQYNKVYPLAIDVFNKLSLWFEKQLLHKNQLQLIFNSFDDIFFGKMSDIIQLLLEYCNDPLVANVDSLRISICELNTDVFSDYYNLLSKKQQFLSQEIDMISSQKMQTTQKIVLLQSSMKDLQVRLDKLTIELEGSHNKQNSYIHLEKQKLDLEEKLRNIHECITPEIKRLILSYIDAPADDITIKDALAAQQHILQLGGTKKSELELAKQKLEQYNQQIEFKKKSLEQYKSQLFYIEQNQREMHIGKLQSEIQGINSQLDQKTAGLHMLQQQYSDTISAIERLRISLQYHCDKINTACPFIDAILKKNKLDQDILILEDKKKSLEKDINYYEELISELQKNQISLQNNLQSLNRDNFQFSGKDREDVRATIQHIESGVPTGAERLYHSQCENAILLLEQSLDVIRLDYKSLQSILTQEVLDQFKDHNSMLLLVTQELLSVQKDQQKNAQMMLQKREFETQINQCLKDMDNLDSENAAFDSKLSLLNAQSHLLSFCSIEDLGNLLPLFIQYVRKLSDLFYEKKRVSTEQDIKKGQLLSATTLHTIANKELVLYVLQSSLPLLNEYINHLLMKVVPFQLRMQINEDGDELELFVEDQFGVREVKSLSGGQKTVLKLCRVLATSIVFRNSFLLLDETINNVDEEVTAQLADMLLDFMRNYNLTFYTVSHSIQLQSMDIWDKVVVIPSIDKVK